MSAQIMQNPENSSITERQAVFRSINRDTYSQLSRHSLIICATLVQNPANLGSLCRTAEAFRVQSLVLSDLAVAESHTFRNPAASTHLWQPMQGCAVAQLPDWIAQQQQAGYSVIALDANPKALSLPQFRFPLRSVLLLGQELTGIPDSILTLADQAVTIPQFGLVESLNVQTAAAVAVYEYLRQHGDRHAE
jgi:tRNA G18 (ribose-2'-O)-methylase SpoU